MNDVSTVDWSLIALKHNHFTFFWVIAKAIYRPAPNLIFIRRLNYLYQSDSLHILLWDTSKSHTQAIYIKYIYMCMLWAQTSRTECTQCTPCMHTLYVYCIAHTVRTVSYTLYALYVHTVRAVCTHCMQMLYAHVWVSTKWPLQDNLCYVILICGHCTAITGQSVSCNALLQDTWACTYNVCSVWIRMCAVCACIYVERAHTHVCSVCIHIVCSVCIHVCVRALSAFYVYMCAENMCNLYMQCMHMFACTL